MKNRNFFSVLSAALLLVSQGAGASTHDLLHYQDNPRQQPSTQSSAATAAEVKALPHLWPPASETKPKAAPAVSPAASGDASAMRAPWVPTATPGGAMEPQAPGVQAAPPVRDLTDLPPCVPVDKYTDEEVIAYPALRYSCVPTEVSATWYAQAGNTVRTTLQALGKKAGWTIVWRSAKDWTIPSSFAHTGQFEAVATWMFRQLAAEGVLCRVRFYEGNQTVVVSLVS